MNIPVIKIGKKSALRETAELKLYEVKLRNLLVDPNGGALALLEADGKKVIYPLNESEGTILTFVRSGCSTFSHIKNIYQIHLDTMREWRYELVTATIEAKVGDVYYATLQWKDRKGRLVFNPCSVGDALILASMAESKIQIIKNVLEEMQELDEWPYEFETIEEGKR